MLQTLRIRTTVILLRSAFRLLGAFRRLFGTRLYFENFLPDRSFNIKSSRSSRRIKINVFEPNEFDKNRTYPVHLNFHGKART